VELVVVTDGERAERWIADIDAAMVRCPVLFILDLNLPKKSGREVLKRIRASRGCDEAPVAVFTSSDAYSDRNDAATLGAERYIRKPFNLDEFLQIGSIIKSMLREPSA
jgi:DNA-binding response OmpR family regulator